MVRLIIMAVAVTVLFPAVSIADSPTTNYAIDGYYKNFFVVYDPPGIDHATAVDRQPLLGSVSNRLRINFTSHPADRWAFAASYALIPRIQDKSLFEAEPNPAGSGFPTYRFSDFRSRLYPAHDDDPGSVGIFHNLDRFFLTINAPAADIYLGRQAIAWGSARVVNPTDILAPYAFDELDTEDRLGVDAVRVRVPIGFMGEIDGGYVSGDEFAFSESAFFLRGRFHALRTDISAMAVGFRENLLLGLDCAGSIGGAGVWIEGAYVLVDALDDRRYGSGQDYLRISVGADYALTSTLYGFAEYHFSQAGSGRAAGYAGVYRDPAYIDGAVYLLGRHYFIPGGSWQITPLLILSGTALTNLSDPSVFIAPRLEYNIAENIYLSAGGYIGIGRRPYRQSNGDPAHSTLVYRSEFGTYADVYFTSFRVYF